MKRSQTQSLTGNFWVEESINGFLDLLTKQGDSQRMIKEYRGRSSRLSRHAKALGIGLQDLETGLFRERAGTCPKTGTRSMESQLSKTACRRTDDLIRTGIITQPLRTHQSDDPSADLIEEPALGLRHNKGVAESTSIRCQEVFPLVLNHFSEATDGTCDWATMTPEMIPVFLEKHVGKNGWRVRSLRHILRFLFWRGPRAQDRSSSIPPIARKRRVAMDRHVASERVAKRFEDRCGHPPMAVRNDAILLIMSRLGLRSQEGITMHLEDSDGSVGRVWIHGKGGDLSSRPLPIDVGEALVAWLRTGRRGTSRHVFVAPKPPFEPLTADPIRRALRLASARSGRPPPQGADRPHSLRHGLAMNLLEKGNSLADSGEVLRHQSMHTTTFYARYDVMSLRSTGLASLHRGAFRCPGFP